MQNESRDKRMPLIGITGPARSGKDTAAGRILGAFGYVREGFADPLRNFVAEITGLSRDELMDSAAKEQAIEWIGRSPRQMLQTLGTEWGRNMVNENLWVLAAMKKVERNAAAGRPTIITDVRFNNEAEAIRARGGVILHIARPDALRVSSHPSEAGVARQPFDRFIVNDGTLSQFARAVDDFLYAVYKAAPYEDME